MSREMSQTEERLGELDWVGLFSDKTSNDNA